MEETRCETYAARKNDSVQTMSSCEGPQGSLGTFRMRRSKVRLPEVSDRMVSKERENFIQKDRK